MLVKKYCHVGLFIFSASFGGNKKSPNKMTISSAAWKVAFSRKILTKQGAMLSLKIRVGSRALPLLRERSGTCPRSIHLSSNLSEVVQL